MSNFTVRDLITRVTLMRPDLDAGLGERLTQEAAKRVFRESFLGQVITTVYPIGNNVNTILLTSQLPYWNGGLPNTLTCADANKIILPTSWDGSTPDFLSGIDPNPAQKTAAEVLRVLQVRTVVLPYFSIGAFQSYLFAVGNATFTATITGTNLYVQTLLSGTLAAGQYLTCLDDFGPGNLDPPFLVSYSEGAWTISNTNLGDLSDPFSMSSSPMPAAYNVLPGAFFIVYQGPVFDETGTLICKGGDVIQSDGSVWSLTSLENYDTLRQVNWQTQMLQNNRPKSSWNASLQAGTNQVNITQANAWSQRSGQIQTSIGALPATMDDPIPDDTSPTFPTYSGMIIDLYPTQGFQTAMEITYSATPLGDIADVVLNLPDEARDAIVNLALSDWLEVPGKEQNLILAENHRQEYERLKSALRTLGLLGMGGSPEFRAPLFGGRGNRYFPFFYNPTLMPGPN